MLPHTLITCRKPLQSLFACAKVLAVLCSLAFCNTARADGLRVVTWNITFYAGGFEQDIKNVTYGTFNGRTLAADVFILQEIGSQQAVNDFLNAINTAPGSPSDWAAAPFNDYGSLNNAFIYRTSKLELLQSFVLTLPSSTAGPRATERWDCRLIGYEQGTEEATVSFYGVHFKADRTSQERRRRQAVVVRNNLRGADTNPHNAVYDGRPINRHVIFAGDFNVYTSSEPAYELLVNELHSTGFQPDNGQLFDPISRPGNWNNNSLFRFIHTQDPEGQMDDRFDQILVTSSLLDGEGFDYQGNYPTPYNLALFNDPQHSYRVWGNDGSRYNQTMATTTNTYVGPTIAQSIITLCGTGGHAPVFADFVVPAQIDTPTHVHLGIVEQDQLAAAMVNVSATGDATRWGNAIQPLSYSLSSTDPVQVPANGFVINAGSTSQHPVIVDTSNTGAFSYHVQIASNAPESPAGSIEVTGTVVPACRSGADLAAPFGTIDLADMQAAAEVATQNQWDFFDWACFVYRAELESLEAQD